MSLYVYAIVDGPCHPAPQWRGLMGAAVSAVSFRSLAAVVSEIAAPPHRDTEAFVCHEALVEALGAHHRTLPVRFGTVFSDASAVTEALTERYESLAADLRRLGDKVELGLLALWRAAPDDIAGASGGEGARYLQARRSAYARARDLASEIDAAVRDVTIERRITLVNQSRLVVRAVCLAEPEDVSVIRDAVDEVRRQRPDVAIVLSGPWPPYSFVTGRPGMDVEPLRTVPHVP